ncbi:hypothetical protein GCM10018980_68040 [Streptomyces capoamus]|uniref:Uncharacterized protein n=1 Tax=Streptomyces capoamus TaxID=68183 RepID=A0A919F2B9_9ACTN|nr:hypothetical protein GCM10010501_73800 [Streptomyces libani subsp. rufus]GHG72267.1 hypothetical protein GCM10018980_68040 [Streptomyces capoamus]
MQVGGGREPDADQVVGGEPVPLQDGGEQGLDPLPHVTGLVPVQLDGSPDRSYRHGLLLADMRLVLGPSSLVSPRGTGVRRPLAETMRKFR